MAGEANPDFWSGVVKMIGIAAGTISLVGAGITYLIKKFIDRQFDAKMEMIRAEKSIYIDRQIGLNAKRSAAITDVYGKMTEYLVASTHLMDAMERKENVRILDCAEEVDRTRKDLVIAVRLSNLYIKKDLAKKLDEFVLKIQEAESRILANLKDPILLEKFKAKEMIVQLTPIADPIYQEVKDEFHRLLGVIGVE